VKVGFTGSRLGLASAQAVALRDLMRRLRPSELHHGDCVGADDRMVTIARDLGVGHVESHPPTDDRMRAFAPSDHIGQPLPYLKRNEAIVIASDVLIAAPDSPERKRSGTWATVRFARKLKRTIYIVMPCGRIEVEGD
jgi:hypothetical protein